MTECAWRIGRYEAVVASTNVMIWFSAVYLVLLGIWHPDARVSRK